MGRNICEDKISAVAGKLKIADRIYTMPNQMQEEVTDSLKLSGGEKERIFLTRAFSGKEHIGFFDEPIAAIDEKSQMQILKIIAEENFDLLIVVTHQYNDEILNLFDEVITMKDGTICS